MSASHQCHARGYARARYLVVIALSLAGRLALGGEDLPAAPVTGCDRDAVFAHVQEQFRIYGPKSEKHEFFGFIYRVDGELASAVVRGNQCRGADGCTVDPTPAAKRIPRNAKVLGEWHTHTHSTGSRMLSIQDVRGANNNRHIRCYNAFYAGPDGETYSWDPSSTSVATAMATRTSLGRYRLDEQPEPPLHLAAAKEPSTEP